MYTTILRRPGVQSSEAALPVSAAVHMAARVGGGRRDAGRTKPRDRAAENKENNKQIQIKKGFGRRQTSSVRSKEEESRKSREERGRAGEETREASRNQESKDGERKQNERAEK